MTSIMAIDKKRVPEKVMARSIVFLLVKQARPETQFPKIVTSRKKVSMRQTFTIKTFSIYYSVWNIFKCPEIKMKSISEWQ